MKNNLYSTREFARIIGKDRRTIKSLENKNIINKGVIDKNRISYSEDDLLKAIEFYDNEKSIKHYDILITNDKEFAKSLFKKYNFKNLRLVDNVKDLNKRIDNTRRIFLQENILNKEEYNFFKSLIKIYNIEVINLDYEKKI